MVTVALTEGGVSGISSDSEGGAWFRVRNWFALDFVLGSRLTSKLFGFRFIFGLNLVNSRR
ncbi:hypothetical protein Hanom_Chr02g00127811 [Helianthus anomalus]